MSIRAISLGLRTYSRCLPATRKLLMVSRWIDLLTCIGLKPKFQQDRSGSSMEPHLVYCAKLTTHNISGLKSNIRHILKIHMTLVICGGFFSVQNKG